jgi:hypothetical protein
MNGYNRATVSVSSPPGGYQPADKQILLDNVSSFSAASCEPSDDTVTASSNTAVLHDACAAIGSRVENDKFKCNHANCEHRTFSRSAELKRHHATTHAAHKQAHWCPFAMCERSAAIGIKSFPRKDKLKDHVRQKHGFRLGANGSLGPI